MKIVRRILIIIAIVSVALIGVKLLTELYNNKIRKKYINVSCDNEIY